MEAENDIEDVFLEKGKTYAFKIIYGEGASYDYHNNIKLNNTILVNIKFPPTVEEELDVELILSIIAGYFIFWNELCNRCLKSISFKFNG